MKTGAKTAKKSASTAALPLSQTTLRIGADRIPTATAQTTAVAAPVSRATAAALAMGARDVALPQSTDADVAAFYASLDDRGRTMHARALAILDTSYDVRRTTGFIRWIKRRDADAWLSALGTGSALNRVATLPPDERFDAICTLKAAADLSTAVAALSAKYGWEIGSDDATDDRLRMQEN